MKDLKMQSRGWRDVVEHFFDVVCADRRMRVEIYENGNEIAFRRQFGTDEFADSLVSFSKAQRTEVEKSNGDVLDIRVVHESDTEVVCDVRTPSMMTTRFKLEQTESWRITDMLQPCLYCSDDPPKPDGNGKCLACGGKGKGFSPTFKKGITLVPFRRAIAEPRVCSHCGGTGKCDNCKDSEMPGWQSVVTLEGHTS